MKAMTTPDPLTSPGFMEAMSIPDLLTIPGFRDLHYSAQIVLLAFLKKWLYIYPPGRSARAG